MNDPRLQSLIERHYSGMLDGEDRAELERGLLSSPTARQQFWQHARFHSLLARWGRETWGRQMADEDSDTPFAPNRWRLPLRLTALAAALALMAGTIWKSPRPAAGNPDVPAVAVLTSTVDASWGDSPESRVQGSLVTPGAFHLNSGLARIEFFNGTRMLIEGPAEVDIIDDRRAYCHSGRLRVHVSETAKGFIVESSGMTVVDLGTEFAVHIQRGQAPEVHVFDGLIEACQPGSSEPPTRVSEGNAVRVVASRVESIPFDEAAFVSEQQFASRAAESSMAALVAWRKQAAALSLDPACKLHLTFEDEPAWTRSITNRAANHDTSADIVGCQWTTGRWPGKRAIQMRGSGDRLRFESPDPLPKFSFFTSLRIDSLPNGYHALLSPDSKNPGTIRWGISGDGCIRLGIAHESGKPEPNWEVVMSKPVIDHARLGHWITLATTFDGKQIRHYLDGIEIAKGAASSSVPPSVGVAEIGNWIESDTRNLPAAIDDFMILERLLSPDELRSLSGLRGHPEL